METICSFVSSVGHLVLLYPLLTCYCRFSRRSWESGQWAFRLSNVRQRSWSRVVTMTPRGSKSRCRSWALAGRRCATFRYQSRPGWSRPCVRYCRAPTVFRWKVNSLWVWLICVILLQAEEFHSTVHILLEWLAEAEQSLRFHGSLPDDEEALRALIEQHTASDALFL